MPYAPHGGWKVSSEIPHAARDKSRDKTALFSMVNVGKLFAT